MRKDTMITCGLLMIGIPVLDWAVKQIPNNINNDSVMFIVFILGILYVIIGCFEKEDKNAKGNEIPKI